LACQYYRFFMQVGYTVTSLLLGASAIVTLWVSLELGERPSWRTSLALGVALGLAWLVRPGGAKGALAFMVPLFAWMLLVNWRSSWRHLLIFLLPFSVLSQSVQLLPRPEPEDTSPGELEFKRWNALRSRFHGYPVAKLNIGNQKILGANDWTLNDYDMLVAWAYLDERKYNVRTLRNVFKYAVPEQTAKPAATNWSKLKKVMLAFWKQQKPYVPLVLCLLLPALVLNSRRRAAFCAVFAVWCVALSIAIGLLLRLPARVGIPTTVSVAFGMALIALISVHRWGDPTSRWSLPIRRWSRIGAVVMLTACLAFSARTARRQIKRTIRYQTELKQRFAALETLDASFLVTQPGRSPGQYQDPLRRYTPDYLLIPMGWHIFSPLFYERLRAAGLEHAWEVFPRMVEDDRAFLVGNQRFVERIVTFLEENYDVRAKGQLVRPLFKDQSVYQLGSDPHSGGAK
jgi:hypothetical protein